MLASTPSRPGLIPRIPDFFVEIVHPAEVYQWHRLEESGQRLKNVDQYHLVVASGKQVLQKSINISLK